MHLTIVNGYVLIPAHAIPTRIRNNQNILIRNKEIDKNPNAPSNKLEK